MSKREKLISILKQATKPLTLEQLVMFVKADKSDIQEELDRLYIADKIVINVNRSREKVYSWNQKRCRR